MSGNIVRHVTEGLRGRWKWTSLDTVMVLSGLASTMLIVAIVVPDRREISVKDYRWLSEQAQAFPEMKEPHL